MKTVLSICLSLASAIILWERSSIIINGIWAVYYAVRIYTPDVVLEDDQFMDAASSTLNGYYKSYLKSIAPAHLPLPSSSPTPSSPLLQSLPPLPPLAGSGRESG